MNDTPDTSSTAAEKINSDGQPESVPSPLRDSKGWDGKLRVNKQATLANPEALTDPEYSDEENVIQGEQLVADEGWDCHTGREGELLTWVPDLLEDYDDDTDVGT